VTSFFGAWSKRSPEFPATQNISPVRFDDVRRVLVRRFPYAVYFYHDDDSVFITYVFHTALNPRKLVERPRSPNQAMEDNDLGGA
jgi:hypothetical protein